jgi:hypothetical protein
VDACREQILLRAEVRVDHRLRNARYVGDLVHRRVVVAPFGEHRDRGVEDLPLTDLAREPFDPPPLFHGHRSSPRLDHWMSE